MYTFPELKMLLYLSIAIIIVKPTDDYNHIA